RLLRQLLTEHVVLGLLAGGIAVLVSAWLVDALRLFTPFIEYPLELTLAVGFREIGYAAAASVAAALLVGIWPALRLSEGRLADALKAGARQSGGERRGAAFRAGLVVGEVALAMFALAAAGLLVRSFQNVRRADPGFDASGVLLAGVNLSTGGYDRAAGLAYLQRVLERTGGLPGVSSVSLAEDVPLGFSGGSWEDLTIDGYMPAANDPSASSGSSRASSRDENMKSYRNLVSPN